MLKSSDAIPAHIAGRFRNPIGFQQSAFGQVSFVVPYTYVFDRDGDKTRTVQFRAAGIIAPNSLFFGNGDRILVTPGLYEFGAGRAAPILPFPPLLPDKKP